jgi:hypothetical protein
MANMSEASRLDARLKDMLDSAKQTRGLPNDIGYKIDFRDRYLTPLLEACEERTDIWFGLRACMRFLNAGLTWTLPSDDALRAMLIYADEMRAYGRMTNASRPTDVQACLREILLWAHYTVRGHAHWTAQASVRAAVSHMTRGFLQLVSDDRLRARIVPVIELLEDEKINLENAINQSMRMCEHLAQDPPLTTPPHLAAAEAAAIAALGNPHGYHYRRFMRSHEDM